MTHVIVPDTLILNTSSINALLGTVAGPVVTVQNTSYFTVSVSVLPLPDTLVVAYQATLIDTVRPNQQITQTINTEYTSTSAVFRLIGRLHNSLASGWTTAQTLLQMKMTAVVAYVDRTDVVETPETPLVLTNIAEAVAYRARVTMPETMSDAVVSVVLPAGVIYCNATVIFIGSSIQNSALTVGQVIAANTSQITYFNFGTINLIPDNVVDANDEIIVEVC